MYSLAQRGFRVNIYAHILLEQNVHPIRVPRSPSMCSYVETYILNQSRCSQELTTGTLGYDFAVRNTAHKDSAVL